jgi:hypothetical protein
VETNEPPGDGPKKDAQHDSVRAAEDALELIRKLQWGEVPIEGLAEEPDVELRRFITISEVEIGGGVTVVHAKDQLFSRDVCIRDYVKASAPRDEWDSYIQRIKKLIFNNHPSLAGVLEVKDRTIDRSGRTVCVVGEWIDGENLAKRLKRSPRLTPREAAQLFLAASGALAFLHQRKVHGSRCAPADFCVGSDGRVLMVRFGEAPGLFATPADYTPAADLRRLGELILQIAPPGAVELLAIARGASEGARDFADAAAIEAAVRKCIEASPSKYGARGPGLAGRVGGALSALARKIYKKSEPG